MTIVIFGILIISITQIAKINLASINTSKELKYQQEQQIKLMQRLNIEDGYMAGLEEFCQKYAIACIHRQGENTKATIDTPSQKLPIMPAKQKEIVYDLY